MAAGVAARQSVGSNQKIAMTAPVALLRSSHGWLIRFNMQAKWTLQSTGFELTGPLKCVVLPSPFDAVVPAPQRNRDPGLTRHQLRRP